MRKANLRIRKKVSESMQPAIIAERQDGDLLGYIYKGRFMPHDNEVLTNEMITIISIMKSFNFYYDNIKEQ